MKIKVYWKCKTQDNNGHYGEDDPEADYPKEVYYPPTWTSRISVQERESKDIKKILNEPDGDDDFSNNIMFICDDKDRVLLDYSKLTSEHIKGAENLLIFSLGQEESNDDN